MPAKTPCADFELLAVLYAAEELDPETRDSVEQHAQGCPACGELLAEEVRSREALLLESTAAGEADPPLLARCRHELSGAIAELTAAGALGWRKWLLPDRWVGELRRGLALRPGWTAAALLVAGALGGMAAGALYRAAELPISGSPAMTVSAAPSISDRELETMGIEAIHVEDRGADAAPQIEVQLLSKKPMVVVGTPDDAEVRRVLTYVVEHGQRFDPSVRLDSLDVLRTRAGDPRVRAALCAAARKDSNPAVRLKALAALDGLSADPVVRRTILAALAEDGNSGIRIEAMNALLAGMGGGIEMPNPGAMLAMPPQALQVLRDRERNDSNSYVRMRSARALSQLASYGDSGGAGGSH